MIRFLLAKLQLDHIFSFREPRKRMKALETVPRDMSSAYKDVMKRIEQSKPGDKELAIKILSWLFYAFRPLLMDELLEALVVEDGDRDLQRDDMLTPADVVECCKSLVVHEISTGLVRFPHYTVQEFIEGIKHDLAPMEVVAKTCLNYLFFDEFGEHCSILSVDDRKQKYKLSFYAASYIGDHLRGEPEKSADIQETFVRVFASNSRRLSIRQLQSDFSLGQYGFFLGLCPATLLQEAADKGLATICSCIIDAKNSIKNTYVDPEFTFFCLTEAFRPLRRTLLELPKEDDITAKDLDGNSILHFAAASGHTDVTRALLDRGADVNAINHGGSTVLTLAMAEAPEETVWLLVERGADIMTSMTWQHRDSKGAMQLLTLGYLQTKTSPLIDLVRAKSETECIDILSKITLTELQGNPAFCEVSRHQWPPFYHFFWACRRYTDALVFRNLTIMLNLLHRNATDVDHIQHKDISADCQECHVPIVGRLHRCTSCSDFNLCHSCYLKPVRFAHHTKRDHEFLQIPSEALIEEFTALQKKVKVEKFRVREVSS